MRSALNCILCRLYCSWITSLFLPFYLFVYMSFIALDSIVCVTVTCVRFHFFCWLRPFVSAFCHVSSFICLLVVMTPPFITCVSSIKPLINKKASTQRIHILHTYVTSLQLSPSYNEPSQTFGLLRATLEENLFTMSSFPVTLGSGVMVNVIQTAVT